MIRIYPTKEYLLRECIRGYPARAFTRTQVSVLET